MVEEPSNMQSIFVKVDDFRLHYVVAGEGEPVIFLHGIPTSSYLWRNVIPPLSTEYRCYGPDMLGYGHSEKPERRDVSISAQADLMNRFMEKLGIDRAAIVGHDLGGGVAQIMGVRYPERVNRLVLIDSVCYDSWPIPQLKAMQNIELETRMSPAMLETMLRRMLPQGVYHKDRMQDGPRTAFVEPWTNPWGLGAFLQNARALNPKYTMEIAPELKRLDIPVLIIWGREDAWQKVKYGERLHQDIRGSRMDIIPKAGHYVMEDDPQRVVWDIREFLRNTAPLPVETEHTGSITV